MRSNEYRNMKDKGFFTSRELADICSVNRMTVIRMEERGLLTPEYKTNAGVRYYSLNGLMQLKHILLLEKCGLNSSQIKDLFGDTVNNPDIISNMLNDLIMVMTILDADKDPFTNYKKGKIRSFDMNEHLCFIRDFEPTGDWDVIFRQFHDALKYAADKKYKMVTDAPSLSGRLTEDGELLIDRVYIPVRHTKNNEGLEMRPGTRIIYASWYGDPAGVRNAFKAMYKEAENRNYKPRGDCLVVSMADHYSMTDYDRNDVYLFLMLPVE